MRLRQILERQNEYGSWPAVTIAETGKPLAPVTMHRVMGDAKGVMFCDLKKFIVILFSDFIPLPIAFFVRLPYNCNRQDLDK